MELAPTQRPRTTSAHGGQLHVFIGPSLDHHTVASILPAARIEPPIARGDLGRLEEQGAGTFLIIDGAFAHRLAVAPSEIVDAIARGARVTGAASIGAIRAAECWPAAMDGVGAVYRWYRLGVLRDDDEVAVATDPERAFAAVSIALVSVRYAALAGLRAGLLDRPRAAAVLAAARQTHFAERQWRTIFSTAGVTLSEDMRALCDRTDVKRRDALAAVHHLARRAGPTGAPPPRKLTGHRFAGGTRYAGASTTRRLHGGARSGPGGRPSRELTAWLLNSGRYSRYFDTAPSAASDGAALEEAVWDKLAAAGALEHELMHWYAERRTTA